PDRLSVAPLTAARDIAEARSSYIGQVNPRTGGLVNRVIQTTKRGIARGLGWFVRGQVEVNQSVLDYMDRNTRGMAEQNETLYQATREARQEIAGVREAQIWMEELREAHSKMEMRTLQILRTVEPA